jgi:uncharacterized membrane protein YgdD (TMEM256/DUF423 family)
MARLSKFLHTVGAIGLAGAMVSLLAMLVALPETTAVASYASVRAAMRAVADYVLLPALALTILSGFLSFAMNQAYMNSGWAIAKLASGIVLFEGTLVAVHGPARRAAEQSAKALADGKPEVVLSGTMSNEWLGISVVLAVAIANVALGVWRPRIWGKP